MRSILGLIKLFFWKYLRHAIAALPVALINAAAWFPTLLLYIVSRGKRRVMLSEFSKCGIDADGGLIWRSFSVQMRSQIKMFYLSKINSGNVNKYFKIKGLEYLQNVKGKGGVLLNPHFGPFMLVMPALGHNGYKLNQVALQGDPIIGKRHGIEKLIYESKFSAIEKNMPVNFINAAGNEMAVRGVFQALKNNEFVLFASTGRAGRAWHEVEFLGRRATFNVIPFRMALKEGAIIVPIFLLDSKPYAELIIEKPVDITDGVTVENLVEKYAACLESYVRKYPEYFAFYLHDMFVQRWWDDHPFFLDYPADEFHRQRSEISHKEGRRD